MARSYTRRSPEEIVAQYEKKIAAVKARAAAKEAARKPDYAAFAKVVRSVRSAIGVAAEEDNTPLEFHMKVALEGLEKFAEAEGVPFPPETQAKPRKPRLVTEERAKEEKKPAAKSPAKKAAKG